MFGLGAIAEFAFGQLKGFNPIESASERRSAFNFCNPFDHVLPLPDSTIDANDRMQLFGWYTGSLSAVTGIKLVIIERFYRQLMAGH